MRKAKATVGYVPEAKPKPVNYSKVGNKSEHLQKTIGGVPDDDVVKFERREITADEKERTQRLTPENWGIDRKDLQYNERQNRSYFKVEGVEGWFAWPPVKWTDSKKKEWYGLAHYEKKPDEVAKAKGEGGTHFDSIAFPVDSTPPEAISGRLSVGYTRDNINPNADEGSRANKGDVVKRIRNRGVRLQLAEGAVGHPRSEGARKEVAPSQPAPSPRPPRPSPPPKPASPKPVPAPVPKPIFSPEKEALIAKAKKLLDEAKEKRMTPEERFKKDGQDTIEALRKEWFKKEKDIRDYQAYQGNYYGYPALFKRFIKKKLEEKYGPAAENAIVIYSPNPNYPSERPKSKEALKRIYDDFIATLS
jgi:hypothetical protein